MKIKGEIDMEYRERRPEVEIDLKEIMGLILHNTTIIILAALCAGIFLFTQGKLNRSTIYTSTTKMYVLSRNNLEDTLTGDANVISSVLEDYQALVTSKEVLEEVNRRLELGSSYEQLLSQIAITIPQENKIVQLSVTDANPFKSMEIANTLRDVMAEYMENMMDVKLFDVVEKAMVGTPTTVDKAKRNAVLGAVIVACMVIGLIVMRYLIDDRIKTAEEIETKLGLSVLASIPMSEKQMPQKKKRRKRR